MCCGGPGCRRRSSESGGSKDLIRGYDLFCFFMYVFDSVIRFHKKCCAALLLLAAAAAEQLHTVYFVLHPSTTPRSFTAASSHLFLLRSSRNPVAVSLRSKRPFIAEQSNWTKQRRSLKNRFAVSKSIAMPSTPGHVTFKLST